MKTTFRWIAVALAAACTCGVRAEISPYYIGGSIGYTHQSNALGLADGEEASQFGYESRSDNVTTYSLIGGLDQNIGRQHLFGNATLRHNKYAHNSGLDNNGHSLTAGVDWETAERLSGNLTVKSDRDLIHYSTVDRLSSVANISTSRLVDFTARLGVTTPLTLEAGANRRSIDYSDPAYASREYSQNQVMLGARFRPAGYNTVGLAVRRANGDIPNYRSTTGVVGDSYERQDIDLSTWLEVSGLTNIYARLSHTKLEYDQQTNFNFSGLTGLLKATWMPAGKLKFVAEIARDRAQDLRSTFIAGSLFDLQRIDLETSGIANAVRLRADWEATAKIKVNANVGYTRRDVNVTTTPLLGAPQSESGTERVNTFGLGGTWAPTRTSLIGCDITRYRQRSDLTLTGKLNMTSNVTGCYAQLTLQP